ncbi:RNA-directed DNA polymerase [Comamonas koreensis]|uniref:RNA-directed DNA polymerase n=1 Tax=Comamonas koreensis TaxID=160825 RepID=UPI0015F8C6C2|nr:RNA-directed DNA polymerase [Comamonas koreensis]
MSIIKSQFQALPPQWNRLVNVVVLSQAWKKSHAFIRQHNWYADVLELDASALNLEDRLNEWAKQLEKRNFKTDDLRLVPAPKNARWDFQTPTPSELLLDEAVDDINRPHFNEWRPRVAMENDTLIGESSDMAGALKLRPLAHISVRDQTLATAVMACLAEAVETAQGNPSGTDDEGRMSRLVVSYGNRLHCSWVKSQTGEDEATFSWGNGKTYRQYFQDYRTFLARPRQVCAELSPRISVRRELFVVSLDIKSFFDNIDQNALVKELQVLEAEHADRKGLPQELSSDAKFWNSAKKILKWQWQQSEHDQSDLIGGVNCTELPLGIPQGLVAAGFLANAYLVRFDRIMQEKALAVAPLDFPLILLDQNLEIHIRDYCRYVDDMRIVVEARGGLTPESLTAIKERVECTVGKLLQDHCKKLGAEKKLEFSSHKSDAKPYRAMAAQSHVSALMELLKGEVSGTFDLESLTQAAGGLDGLLWMSDQIDEEEEKRSRSRMGLANIAVTNTDVRDDTVKRFVASRLTQVLRHRLAMTDREGLVKGGSSLSDKVTLGQLLSHEFESSARKLINCWAQNPALALLLRCGLDLFPHPRLLSPILEALEIKLFHPPAEPTLDQRREIKTAQYITADIFRAGAIETGFRQSEDYPDGIDSDGYREDLAAFARRIIERSSTLPWYVLQQAMLYLSSMDDYCFIGAVKVKDEQLDSYFILQKVAQFQTVTPNEVQEALPFALVAQQLHPNIKRFGTWFTEVLRSAPPEITSSVVKTVCLNRPDLILSAMKARGAATNWKQYIPRSLMETSRVAGATTTIENGAQTTAPLSMIIAQPSNPFSQENGVLMLAAALLRKEGIEKLLANGLGVADITLECKEWPGLHAVPIDSEYLLVSKIDSPDRSDPLCEIPEWVDDDKAWLYGLGRILRSALTGEIDFTSRRYLVTEDFGRYSGLRSTWYLRRFGLMNSGRALFDEPAPVSPWLSGLLSCLLQWPGVDFRADGRDEIFSVKNRTDLLTYVEKRMHVQAALFGPRSRTPMYVVPVDDHRPLVDRPLRVAIVQPMRPRLDEFNMKDPTHWTPKAIAEHRRHLAEVCRLTHQKLKTWASATQNFENDSSSEPIVDLLVFPELAIHPEHTFLLRRLSDDLKANIFAGLTFFDSPRAGGTINQGLWIIREESEAHGRTFQYVWQGKKHPMKLEAKMGIKGYRPHMTLVELPIGAQTRTRVAAAICFDATDLDLVADLRDRSDVFLVAALNQDVQTFDNMVAALHFHMYQPVILANSGEFGGSTAQVPLPKHDRLVAHVHGNQQVAVSVFEIDPSLFKSTATAKAHKEKKSPPAGYKGRPV